MNTKAAPAAGVVRRDLWIGGRHVAPSSGRYFDDHNPDDDSVIAHIAEGSTADVDAAVNAAQAAFADYSRTLAAEREAWLCRAAGIKSQRGNAARAQSSSMPLSVANAR